MIILWYSKFIFYSGKIPIWSNTKQCFASIIETHPPASVLFAEMTVYLPDPLMGLSVSLPSPTSSAVIIHHIRSFSSVSVRPNYFPLIIKYILSSLLSFWGRILHVQKASSLIAVHWGVTIEYCGLFDELSVSDLAIQLLLRRFVHHNELLFTT